MASINYVPGVGFVRNIPGTDRTVVMGSPEERAMKQRALKEQQDFMSSVVFDSSKDYSGTWDKLFGAQPTPTGYSPTFGGGPQGRWQGAMSDRLQKRREGMFDDVGFYERYAQHSDRNWQRSMYERNNAIEDMYRHGYDMSQINAHLAGERNVLEEGPSWRDYYKEKQAAGEGVNWTDGYFKGAPDQDYGGYVGQRLSTALDTMADKFNKFFGNTAFGIDDTPIPQPTPDVFPEQEDRPVTRGLFGKYINKGQEQ